MRWATTPGGKRNPLDADPSPEGNVLVVEGSGGSGDWLLAVVIHDAELLEEARQLFPERMHLSHFATCPNADEHRRPRERSDLA